ncbi:DUF3309 family protein [Criblamydia sequanensis]|uniref:DUF3309 family protein n=1 Tax=Candidatus Criblamydia sequanensis TaxID=340071 RepID=UPI000595D1A9
MSLILLLILILLLTAAFPVWNYSLTWGYKPTVVISLLLIIYLLLIFSGRVILI